MFITNSDPDSLMSIYTTKSKIVKKYLIDNKIPILSEKNNNFYFSNTNKLQETLNKAPLWIRCLS